MGLGLGLGLDVDSLRAARAEGLPPSRFEVGPGAVSAGIDAGFGQCPCIRWTFRAELVGGQIETRQFLISSDALLALQRREDVRMNLTASEQVTLGAFEAHKKDSRFGLRFDGVTLGSDLDRGATELLRTGLDLIIQWVQSESLRLRFETGIRIESFTMNLMDPAVRTLLPQALALSWNAEPFSGDVTLQLAVPAETPLDPANYVLGLASDNRLRLLTLDDLEFALGAGVALKRDPFFEAWGVGPHDIVTSLVMDIRWQAQEPREARP